MAATIGVEDRFQRKPLLRPPMDMRPDEFEIPNLAAAKQAADFANVFAGMLFDRSRRC